MSPAHNEWTELIALGDADARGLLGVRVDVLRRGVIIASQVCAVVSPVEQSFELSPGGAEGVLTATGTIPRDAVERLDAGDVLRAPDGVTYTVSRVTSLPFDPSYRIELTQ